LKDYSYAVKRWEPDAGVFTRAVIVRFPLQQLHCRLSSQLSELPRRRAILSAARTRATKLLEVTGEKHPVIAFSQSTPFSYDMNETGPYGERIVSMSAKLAVALRREAEKGIDIANHTVSCSSRLLADLINNMVQRGYAAICCLTEKSSGLVNRWDQVLAVSDAIGFPESIMDPELVFNASFFLMEPEDSTSYAAAFGEPIGLVMNSGAIECPALFERSALLQKADSTWIDKLSIEDVSVKIGPIRFVHGHNCRLHTRSQGSSVESDMSLVSVSGKTIHAVNNGGAIEVPDAGFVIETDRLFTEAELQSPVDYELRSFSDVTMAVQTGPVLVREGRALTGFPEEEFSFPSSPIVPPTDLKLDWDSTVAPRMGIGFDKEGNTVVIAVEGSNTNAYVPEDDSRGCTFAELAELFQQEKVTDALYLDGGGSAFLKIHQGMAIKPADRLLRPGLYYHRPVPTVLASGT